MSTLMKGSGSSLLEICEADSDSLRELDQLIEEKASTRYQLRKLEPQAAKDFRKLRH